MKKVNPKHELFCYYYAIDPNGADAARDAGYSVRRARQTAERLLKRNDIRSRISELRTERIERLGIDADYVLIELVKINKMDILDIMDDEGLKPISEWTKEWRQYISGFDIAELWEGRGDVKQQIGLLKKIKFPDKVKNLELLGKHISVGAFANRIEISPAEQFADIIKKRRNKK